MKLFHFQMMDGGEFMTNTVCHLQLANLSHNTPFTRLSSREVIAVGSRNDIYQIKLRAMYSSIN
jgi:hypothetical protein